MASSCKVVLLLLVVLSVAFVSSEAMWVQPVGMGNGKKRNEIIDDLVNNDVPSAAGDGSGWVEENGVLA